MSVCVCVCFSVCMCGFICVCVCVCVFPLCSAGNCWWWIPVAGPLVGGVVGASIYFLLIELHHPEPQRHTEDENNVKDKYEIITMS